MANERKGRAPALDQVAVRRLYWRRLAASADAAAEAVLYRIGSLESPGAWDPPEGLAEYDRLVDRESASGSDPLRRPLFVRRILAPIGAAGSAADVDARTELEMLDAGVAGRLARYDEAERSALAGAEAAAGAPTADAAAPARRRRAAGAIAFDVLVVPSLAHLSTEPSRAARALATLVRAGVHVVAVDDEIDTRRPKGRAAVRAIVRLAWHAAEARRRRTRDVHQKRREEGRPWSRPRWGLMRTDDDRLVADPTLKPLVDEILKLHDAGGGDKAIAQALNRERRLRSGHVWRAATVRSVIEGRDLFAGEGAR